MTIPSIIGTTAETTNASSVTSQAITKPAGTASGEVGVIIICNDIENVTSDLYNTPTGWNKIVGCIPSNANLDCSGMAYWRALTGDSGDDAPTITWTGTAQVVAWYMRVQDADTSDPINIAGVDAQGPGPSLAIPSVTTDLANCLAFYYNTFDGGDGFPFSVSGAGWVEEGELQANTAGNTVSASFGLKDQASAAATGDATVTASVTDGIVGVQFALNEAAAAPSGNPWNHYAQQ